MRKTLLSVERHRVVDLRANTLFLQVRTECIPMRRSDRVLVEDVVVRSALFSVVDGFR